MCSTHHIRDLLVLVSGAVGPWRLVKRFWRLGCSVAVLWLLCSFQLVGGAVGPLAPCEAVLAPWLQCSCSVVVVQLPVVGRRCKPLGAWPGGSGALAAV